MPVVGLLETPNKLPRSINEAVLGEGGPLSFAGAAAAPEKR
jgi:ubiquinol-cytochrome c reductase cytochrome b/c1 subunit